MMSPMVDQLELSLLHRGRERGGREGEKREGGKEEGKGIEQSYCSSMITFSKYIGITSTH